MAATRECLEEIGAQVEVTGLIGVQHIPKTDAPSMVVIAYRGRLVDGARLAVGVEMLEVGVFPLDTLPVLAFPSHQKVIAEYVRSLAPEAAGAPRPDRAAAPRAARPSPAQAPTQLRRRQ